MMEDRRKRASRGGKGGARLNVGMLDNNKKVGPKIQSVAVRISSYGSRWLSLALAVLTSARGVQSASRNSHTNVSLLREKFASGLPLRRAD